MRPLNSASTVGGRVFDILRNLIDVTAWLPLPAIDCVRQTSYTLVMQNRVAFRQMKWQFEGHKAHKSTFRLFLHGVWHQCFGGEHVSMALFLC